MSVCPTAGELTAFLAGSCDGDAAHRIESHLASCESCCEWCMAHDSKDPLLDDVRKVLDTPTPSGGSTGSVLDPGVPEGSEVPEVEGYRIVDELGRGGMGVVYRAVQLDTKREVALKVLLDGAMASTRAKRRFEREVEVAASLSHPNIATILESGLSHGKYYFSMQYISGRSLEAHIRGNGIEVPAIGVLFESICDAVDYAHRKGVIHRDLKPSNIIVDDSGKPYVLDFGLAKTFVDESLESMDQLSMPGELMGTLPYMSPEQVTGRVNEVDTRSDIYALGVMLFKQLTGRYPYSVSGRFQQVLDNIVQAEPTAPSRWRESVNHDLDTIVLKCLSKEPTRRYQSVGEFRDDLTSWRNGEMISAKRDSTTYVLGKTLKRHRRAIALSFVLLLAAGGLLFNRFQAVAHARRAAANGILAAFVSQPADGLAAFTRASGAVRGMIRERVPQLVESGSYSDRVTGARAAFFADPAAFWRSVNDGALKVSGEWLELAFLPPDVARGVQPELTGILRGGTADQRYVALCLIGALTAKDSITQELTQLIVQAADDDDPGIAAAARWAGDQLALALPGDGGAIRHDPLSGLDFISLEGVKAFAVGADENDEWSQFDELQEGASAVAPFEISRTEIPVALYQRFLKSVSPEDASAYSEWYEGIRKMLDRNGDPARDAAGVVSFDGARALCVWLNEAAAKAGAAFRYRLPTEAEWEYASRGGSSTRYCYGTDPRYLHFFARFGGADVWHVTGTRMPNRYGIQDAHGGIWEWCESRYPESWAEDFGLKGRELWLLKGGAFHSPARKCRTSVKNFGTRESAFDYYGVRLVRESLP